jgi:hypothetical protein
MISRIVYFKLEFPFSEIQSGYVLNKELTLIYTAIYTNAFFIAEHMTRDNRKCKTTRSKILCFRFSVPYCFVQNLLFKETNETAFLAMYRFRRFLITVRLHKRDISGKTPYVDVVIGPWER